VSQASIEVRELVVRYGAVVAVRGVTFTVGAGEHLTLLGPSGCGKTTTLRAIAGLMNSTLQWYKPGARLDPDAIADHYMTLVLRGIVTQEVHARLPLGTRALSAGGQHAERRQDG